MISFIKRMICEHDFRITTNLLFMSEGDEHRDIMSYQANLICINCGKKYTVIDKHCKSINLVIEKKERYDISGYLENNKRDGVK